MGRRCGLCHDAVAILCSSCVHDTIKEVRPPRTTAPGQSYYLPSSEADALMNAIAVKRAAARVRMLAAQADTWKRRLSAVRSSTARRQEALTARRSRMNRLWESQEKEVGAMVALKIKIREEECKSEEREKERINQLRKHIHWILSDFQIKAVPCGKEKALTICGWSPNSPNKKEKDASVEAASRVLTLVSQFADVTPHTLQLTPQGGNPFASVLRPDMRIQLSLTFRYATTLSPPAHISGQGSMTSSRTLSRSRHGRDDNVWDARSNYYTIGLGDSAEDKTLKSPRELLAAFAQEIHSERRRKAADAAMIYGEDSVWDVDWECINRPAVPLPSEPDEEIEAYTKVFLSK